MGTETNAVQIKVGTPARIFVSGLSALFMLIGLYGLFSLRALWEGAGFLIVAVIIWLHTVTIRVLVDSRGVSFRRFWRTEWFVPIQYAVWRHGYERKAMFLPGVLIYDRRYPDKVHGLGYRQFSKKDLDKIRAIVPTASETRS